MAQARAARRGNRPQSKAQKKGIVATESNDLRVMLARRLIEANRLPEARAVLGEALAKEPTKAAALDLQRQIGAQ